MEMGLSNLLGVAENSRAVYLTAPMGWRAEFGTKQEISLGSVDLNHMSQEPTSLLLFHFRIPKKMLPGNVDAFTAYYPPPRGSLLHGKTRPVSSSCGNKLNDLLLPRREMECILLLALKAYFLSAVTVGRTLLCCGRREISMTRLLTARQLFHAVGAQLHGGFKKSFATLNHVTLKVPLNIGQSLLRTREEDKQFANRARLPDGFAPGSSHVGIVPDDTTGQSVFSGISHPPPHPCVSVMLHSHLTSASKTSMFRLALLPPEAGMPPPWISIMQDCGFRVEVPPVGECGVRPPGALYVKPPTRRALTTGRKAVQCWDTEIGCAQPARSVYLIFSLCSGLPKTASIRCEVITVISKLVLWDVCILPLSNVYSSWIKPKSVKLLYSYEGACLLKMNVLTNAFTNPGYVTLKAVLARGTSILGTCTEDE
ncbi:hypothetical protein PR048_025804 [Dryococelus australis]|uniref:Uncharacterized protein n=1 Tax=Dryococelus australis TaxID=614101 RepID=A0ABQ9GJL5_9NEOP|nr:hypothetical protein PR048_025804 [Dryococelus australis]